MGDEKICLGYAKFKLLGDPGGRVLKVMMNL